MTLTSLRETVGRLARWADCLARWCAYASAIGIFFIAALLTVSSLKRYIFLTPIQETEELGGLLFMATTFLAIAYGLSQDRHVRLELLWRFLPARWQEQCSLLGYVLVMIALVVLVMETWHTGLGSYAMQNRSVMTELLLWPWRMIMPAALAVVLAVCTLRFLDLVLAMLCGERAAPRNVDEGGPA